MSMNPLDPSSVIAATGVLGIFAVLVAETRLLVGFFLPGDSLLFTAGLLAAGQGPAHLPLGWVLLAAAAGALIGAQLGYHLGHLVGRRLLDRTDRPELRRAAGRADVAITRYGPARAITLARFIPVVRTAMNPTAGIIGVPWRVFTLWQILSGLAWTIGITLAGYWLGSQIPGIDTYLLPIIAVIVAISLVPVGREYLRHRRATTTVPTPTAQTPHQAAAVAAAIERNIP